MVFIRKGNLILILVIKYNVYELVEYFLENYLNLLIIYGVNKLSEIGNENLEML